MKKTFLGIVLVLSLLLCGCNIDIELGLSDSGSQSTQTTPSQSEKKTEKEEAYLDIECRSVSKLQEIYFGFENSDVAFVMSFPT